MPPTISEQQAVVLLRCLKYTSDAKLTMEQSLTADDLILGGLITGSIDDEGELLTTNDEGVSALRLFIDTMNGDVS